MTSCLNTDRLPLAGTPRADQSPWTGVVGSTVAMMFFLTIAIQWGLPSWWGSRHDRDHLLWGAVALSFFLMGMLDHTWFRPAHPKARRRPAYHHSWRAILVSSAGRYLALLLVLTVARGVYFSYPLYRGDYYQPFRELFQILYDVFLAFGLPYILITLRWRADARAEFRDSAVHVLLGIRTGLRWMLQRRRVRSFRWGNRRGKTVVLGFLVEFFFLPLMTVFLHAQFTDFAKDVSDLYYHLVEPTFRQTVFPVLYHGIYLIDVFLAAGGYAFPMRWLDNKIESVDGTCLGWLVAIICYPPFDTISNVFLGYGPSNSAWLDHSPQLQLICQVGMLCFSGVYATATVMFGTRFSNLTHRGILTRGVYSWVRHPAYVAKNISWWFEKLGLMGNPFNLLVLATWNGIYALRALTEEKHLSQDPTYVAYCKKVKYRFIPGLF